MSTNNGIKAFPVLHSIDGNWVREPIEEYQGMTLRDYFAAKAMQALIGKEDKDGVNRGAKAVPLMAQWAYEYADAMLSAREAK